MGGAKAHSDQELSNTVDPLHYLKAVKAQFGVEG